MINIETLREPHIFGYAIFDLALSYVGVYLLAPLLTKLFLKIKIKISRKSWLFLTLPIGIISHLLVGNITPMTEQFFDFSGYYLLKIVIFLMLILGLKDIKIISKNKK